MALTALATLWRFRPRGITFHCSSSLANEQFQPESGGLQGLRRDAGVHIRATMLDVAVLKRSLIAAWSGLQQHVIDEAIE